MSPRKIPYIVSGPSSIVEATKLIEPGDVPFPWDLPPENSISVWQPGTITAPAAATQTVVVSYTVPDGHFFAFKRRLNVFVGQSFVDGSGDITWTTDVDTPVGTTAPQGEPIQGLQAETFHLGSLDHGTVPWTGRKLFMPLNIIRVKVTTTNAINPGAPNYFISILEGWIYPLARGHR